MEIHTETELALPMPNVAKREAHLLDHVLEGKIELICVEIVKTHLILDLVFVAFS